MPSARIARMSVLGMLVALQAVGCTDPKDNQIAQLQQENSRLLADLSAARDQLREAQAQGQQHSQRVAELQQQITQLQQQLAERPEPAEGEWQAVPGGARLLLSGNVLFDPSKVNLKASATSVLDRVARDILSQYPDREIVVIGHTDTDPIRIGKWDDNWQLSCERALSVVRYLIKRGVPADRLLACGAGEFRPIAPNSTRDGKQQNRRVEIYAVHPQSSEYTLTGQTTP